MHQRAVSLCIAGILFLSLFSGCTPQGEDKLTVVEYAFDTVLTIIAYTKDEGVLKEALQEAMALEPLLSKTVEGSDVWRINHANGESVSVSDHTKTVLQTALAVSAASSGAFDCTIAPASALWDFQSNTLPDAAALEAAAALVDYKKLILQGNEVSLPPGHMVDLGGIAKGYAADVAAEYLKSHGVTSALVNFGGNVVAIGEKPGGEAWSIAVQDPDGETGAAITAFEVKNKSAVTSGVYERSFLLDGVRYHHVLNSATGWPVQNELASVTIITENSMLADALSTACLALGYTEAEAMLFQYEGIEAIYVFSDRTLRRHGE